MSDFGIGTILGKIVGKIVNCANSDRKLKCEVCQKMTPHIAISYIDAFKAGDENADNFFRDVLGFANEFVPQPLALGNPYACYECKRIRFEGGLFSNAANEKDKNNPDLHL
jgi:hypothetical protein